MIKYGKKFNNLITVQLKEIVRCNSCIDREIGFIDKHLIFIEFQLISHIKLFNIDVKNEM